MQRLQISFNPFPILETKRMILRKINFGDADQLFKMRSNPEVMKYIGKPPFVSIEEARALIKVILDTAEKNDGITWAMAFPDTPGVLVGTIGLWRIIKENYRAEIGYMISPKYWRKGLTKEAIAKVCEFGFQKLRLHSIEGRINPLNIASASILEQAGFIKEAHFKEDYFFNGKFEDTGVYSLLNPAT